MRFARGGQAFAAANAATVQLYATYTCESLGIIRCECTTSSASTISPASLFYELACHGA